MHYSSNLFW